MKTIYGVSAATVFSISHRDPAFCRHTFSFGEKIQPHDNGLQNSCPWKWDYVAGQMTMGLCSVSKTRISTIPRFSSTQPGRRKVYDIRVDSRGNEWLLTDRGVILVGDVPFKSNLSYKSWIERSGTIWLGTPNGVVSVYGLDTGELSFVEGMPHEVSHLNRMQPVNDSTVLMQTNAGVVFIDVRTRKPDW